MSQYSKNELVFVLKNNNFKNDKALSFCQIPFNLSSNQINININGIIDSNELGTLN